MEILRTPVRAVGRVGLLGGALLVLSQPSRR
jgi:hypothetical protein